MTSNAAASTYAATGKSVNGGCRGLPLHPRSPLNFRPRRVSVGRTEYFRIVDLLVLTLTAVHVRVWAVFRQVVLLLEPLASWKRTQQYPSSGSRSARRPVPPSASSTPSSRQRFIPQTSSVCSRASRWNGQLCSTVSPCEPRPG